MKLNRVFYALALSGALAACTTTPVATSTSSDPVYGSTADSRDSRGIRSGYGTVEGIQTVDRKSPGLLGTISGAVVGGLLGNQIGSGRGQTAATIAGAAGGAIAGREIERRTRGDNELYKIFVRMDDGTYQAIAQETIPPLRPGDRVHVYNGVVSPL